MTVKLDPLAPVVGYDVVFHGEERVGRDDQLGSVVVRQPTPRRERCDSVAQALALVEGMLRRDGAAYVTIEVVRR
jgi:hypothetical protein